MMKFIFVTAVAVICTTALAHADERFLRAAAFFLSGYENPNLRYSKGFAYGFETLDGIYPTEDGIIQDKKDPCTVHYFMPIPDIVKTVNFNRMPAPTDFGYSRIGGGIGGGPHSSSFVTLPLDAMIETKIKKENGEVVFVPTGKRWKEMLINDDWSGRRLNALNFIRNNYCAGLPELRGF